MKLAIITDTHVGARSGSSIFRDYFKWWYEKQFFDKLDEQCIGTVLHLGDFFDNRNAITLSDIDFVCEWFAQQLVTRNIQFYCTLGNHDVAHKNTNRIHSLKMLARSAPDNVVIIEETDVVKFGDMQFALVPWINRENYDDTFNALSLIQNKANTIVAGHFEIQGAKHYAKSAPAEHGLDPSVFSEFKEVWSGHFHHKSKMSNVRYMGSAFHLNWQDYNDARGYHIYDTDTDELTFVENEYCLFVEVAFDETIFKALNDTEAAEMFGDRFVRLVVSGNYNKVALMDAIALINRSKPHDLQVINHTIVKTDTGEDATVETEVNVAKSTQEYIELYVESRSDYNTVNVKTKMAELFSRATAQLSKGE